MRSSGNFLQSSSNFFSKRKLENASQISYVPVLKADKSIETTIKSTLGSTIPKKQIPKIQFTESKHFLLSKSVLTKKHSYENEYNLPTIQTGGREVEKFERVNFTNTESLKSSI